MKEKRNARERLIVALDCPSLAQAMNLVTELGDEVSFYKIGWRLFLQGGLEFVRTIRDEGKDVFLDLKMDDIAETIETAVAEVRDDAMFLTIHGSGATARAAKKGRGEKKFPKLLSVTLLSSLDEQDVKDIFSFSGSNGAQGLDAYVLHRTKQALENGCDGLIASGESVRLLRSEIGDGPIIVAPGIRPTGSAADDHKRSSTPSEAILNGADCLVVGRPIRLSPDPLGAAKAILDEMDAALARA